MITTPLFLLSTLLAPAQDFETHFTGRTLRFDYRHAGRANEEHVCPERFRLEGEWPGSRTRLLDDTNLGKYLFVVIDPRTNLPLWSQGFSSIYGEWETTGEARETWRAFGESQRFPEPRDTVQLVLRKRAADGTFREIFSTTVDPASRFVDRSDPAPIGTATTVFENGPSAVKVDLLVVGEGYTAEQAGKFEQDARRLSAALFETEPFRARRADFNLRLLLVPSPRPGISDPRTGRWNATPLGLSYNAFDSDRYVLTEANQALREAAAQVPHDALILLFNERKYGGGGIFNLWATCAADTEPAAYVFVHEFGHSFAGLADEYYTSQVSYEDFTPEGSEPWEPNVTALLDPSRLKWRDLVASGVPLPTPWDQAAYDEASYAYQARRTRLRAEGADEAVMEELFREVKATTQPLLERQEYFGRVGAFEGAGYRARGLYRPEVDCIMFTRNPTTFCRVCTRAIERAIDRHTR